MDRDSAARRFEPPHGAIDPRHGAAIDIHIAHVAEVAVVVFGMRCHGQAERVRRGPKSHDDRPTGEVGTVDAKGVLDLGFERRMVRRRCGDEESDE